MKLILIIAGEMYLIIIFEIRKFDLLPINFASYYMDNVVQNQMNIY